MIEIIRNIVETFIEDWRNSPYEWESEVDIQAEIAQRLRLTLKSAGKFISKAGYDYIRNGMLQDYSRVCCEPRIYYNDSKGNRYWCLPDIVVYDCIEDPNDPPDAVPEKNWPMLWVCEIKYQTEDKDTSKQNKAWDTEKMEYLLEQKETKHACELHFDRRGKDTKPIRFLPEQDGRLRNYTALPRK